MRTLFLVLVLANIVAFIWYGWLRSPAQTPSSMLLPHVQTLKLIAELTPAQRRTLTKPSTPAPEAESTPNPVTNQTAAESCASYGPFPSIEAAQTGATRLQNDGASVTQRLVPGKVRLGYWVYLPPFGSRHEADAAAKLLAGRGVTDLYVVTDEANRNAISLGVFRDVYGARARQKKIQLLGFRPLLTERFRDSPRYWLDARGAETRLPAAGAFADLDEGDVSIGRAACNSPASH